MYVEANPLGGGEKAQRGDAFYTAPNPPFGAVVTYHLKEDVLSLREQRRKRERTQAAAGEPLPYPTWDELRAEDRAEDPAVFVVIRAPDGEVVRRIPHADKGRDPPRGVGPPVSGPRAGTSGPVVAARRAARDAGDLHR